MSVPHSEAMGVLLQANLDGELDALQSADLALHVAGCDECQALLGQLRGLNAALRTTVPRYQAPEALRRSLTASIAVATKPQRRRFRLSWVPAGGFLAGAAVAAAVALTVLPIAPPEAIRVAGEVAAATLRAREPGHLLDRPGAAPTELAAWFQAGLGFAPPVREIAGFTLAGARLDYVHGRRTAVLVYRRDGRTVTLYLWPEKHTPTPPVSLASAGVALSYWRADGVEFWAAGDTPGDVRTFADGWRGKA
jgi:anti-sigma factor RsiW